MCLPGKLQQGCNEALCRSWKSVLNSSLCRTYCALAVRQCHFPLLWAVEETFLYTYSHSCLKYTTRIFNHNQRKMWILTSWLYYCPFHNSLWEGSALCDNDLQPSHVPFLWPAFTPKHYKQKLIIYLFS